MRQIEDGLRPCPISDPDNELYDPETCQSQQLCEVERDGDHEFWECEDCGYAFGWRIAPETGGIRIDGLCQTGQMPAPAPSVQLGMPGVRGRV